MTVKYWTTWRNEHFRGKLTYFGCLLLSSSTIEALQPEIYLVFHVHGCDNEKSVRFSHCPEAKFVRNNDQIASCSKICWDEFDVIGILVTSDFVKSVRIETRTN
jgi:hypothetical protein